VWQDKIAAGKHKDVGSLADNLGADVRCVWCKAPVEQEGH